MRMDVAFFVAMLTIVSSASGDYPKVAPVPPVESPAVFRLPTYQIAKDDTPQPSTRPPAAPVQVQNLQPPPAQAKMYRIQCRVTETNAAGKVDVISSPQMMTVEGQAASAQVGASPTPPDALGPSDDLFCGIQVKFVVRRGKNQQTILDASFELRQDQHPTGERVVITNRGVRVIEAVTLGQAFVVSLPNDAGKPATRCEFTVFDATAELREAQAKRGIRR